MSMEAGREQVEGWKKNPWSKLPTWARWGLGILGALILLGIGAAIGSGEEDDLKAEVTELTAERDQAIEEVAAVVDRKEQILSAARSSAADIIGDARSERSAATGKLRRLRSEVSATQNELAQTESSLAGAEHEEALSTISDGTWQAETDFIPGTYRAPGGSNCYWATLNSADPYDIASNENGTGPQIATIESPYFQTDGCGTWERIE
jgi:transposase-like protein